MSLHILNVKRHYKSFWVLLRNNIGTALTYFIVLFPNYLHGLIISNLRSLIRLGLNLIISIPLKQGQLHCYLTWLSLLNNAYKT